MPAPPHASISSRKRPTDSPIRQVRALTIFRGLLVFFSILGLRARQVVQGLAQAADDQHQHENDQVFECHAFDPSGVRVAEYIVPIRIGSRIFDPRLFTTCLTLVLIAALLALGRWQLRRADEKRALDERFAAGAEATRSIDGETPPLPRYQHIEATGAYDSTRQVLIDNMSSGEDSRRLLRDHALRAAQRRLDLAQSRLGAARREPGISRRSPCRRGRASRAAVRTFCRGPGLNWKPAPPMPPYPVAASFPTHDGYPADLLHESAWSRAADVVLLDSSEPDGYLRQWQCSGFPPMRHLAYAFQRSAWRQRWP